MSRLNQSPAVNGLRLLREVGFCPVDTLQTLEAGGLAKDGELTPAGIKAADTIIDECRRRQAALRARRPSYAGGAA